MSQDSRQSSASYKISIIVLSKLCSIILIQALYPHYILQCSSCMRYLMSGEQTRKKQDKDSIHGTSLNTHPRVRFYIMVTVSQNTKDKLAEHTFWFSRGSSSYTCLLAKLRIISLFTQSCQS